VVGVVLTVFIFLLLSGVSDEINYNQEKSYYLKLLMNFIIFLFASKNYIFSSFVCIIMFSFVFCFIFIIKI
jgi:hypothetical protein